jgi:regulator of protease activity HflC (stomatin/prohibitin superfamily)
VDEDEFFTLVNRLRASLPEEVKEAVRVSKEADRVMAEAHERASKVMSDAREQAAILVSQDEIIKQAQRQAEEIIAQAQQESARIRGEMADYCRQSLDNLEKSVQHVLEAIDKGRQALKQAPQDQ